MTSSSLCYLERVEHHIWDGSEHRLPARYGILLFRERDRAGPESGSAGWVLIWSFLRCSDFATFETPGPQYHLERTVPATNETEETSANDQTSDAPEHVINSYNGFQNIQGWMHNKSH